MSRTPLRVFPSPEAIGEHLAGRLLDRIELARREDKGFILGCPTGRTPRTTYDAMARYLAEKPQDLSNLVLAMMDDYVVAQGGGFDFVPADKPWSSRRFARIDIVDRLNAGLAPSQQISEKSIWLPDPRSPEEYDDRIAKAGGIDFFILASGASDGHVAFNPPGSWRESRTRIIRLSEDTRRDNLQTFPDFGSIAAVPTHGISVGIDTIALAKEAVMVVWGKSKRLTLGRIQAAERFDRKWPATVIHECAVREILADADASSPPDA
jgi:glucosamine-6-phosphate deaminase